MEEQQPKTRSIKINTPFGEVLQLNAPIDATDEQISAASRKMVDAAIENRALNTFSQNEDTTPTAPVRRPDLSNSFIPGRRLQPKATEYNPDAVMRHNNAAEAGVDVTSGAPPWMRAHADLLSLKPAARLAALEYLVDRDMKENGITLPKGISSVFKEDYTGKLGYYRPTEEGKLKKTLVNAYGIDSGDIASSIDDVVAVGVEGTAAVGGGLLTGMATANPAGIATGGVIAAGAANAIVNKARKELARQLGLPDTIVDQLTSDDMFNEATTAMAYEAAGPVGAGFLRGIRNSTRPIRKVQDVDELVATMKKAIDVSEELFERTGVRVTATLGSATRNPEILVLEANAKRAVSGKLGQELREADVRNRAATGDAILRINDNAVDAGPRLNSDVATQGERARGVIASYSKSIEEKAVLAAEDQLDHLDTAADLSTVSRWTNVQSDLAEQSAKAQSDEQVVWDTFREQVGFDDKTHTSKIMMDNRDPTGLIPEAMANINVASQEALSSAVKGAKQSLLRDVGYGEQAIVEGLSGKTLDMQQVHVLLSHLKKAARDAAGPNKLGWHGKDLSKLIGAIEGQMGQGAFVEQSARGLVEVSGDKAQTVLATFKLGVEKTNQRHAMFNTKAVRELFTTVSKDNDSFAKSGNAVRQLLFKAGDPSSLAEVLRVTGANPAKRAPMLEELNVMYKQTVFRDGKFLKANSDVFLQNYSEHIKMLTGSNSTTDFITNAVEFDRVVKAANTRATRVKQSLSDVYGKKLGGDDVYGGNIASDMLNDKLTLDQIGSVKKRLARQEPALWGDVQEAGLVELKDKMLKASGLEANAKGVRSVLKGNEGRLKAIYGEGYVRNLELMQDALSAMEGVKLAKASKILVQPTWLQVVRTQFGPLSATQRRLTAAVRLQRGMKEANLYSMMSNPEQLEKFVKLNRTTPGTVAYLQAATAAGLNIGQMVDSNPELLEEFKRHDKLSVQQKKLKHINARRRKERVDE